MNKIKVLGLVTSVLGVGVSLVSEYVNDKKLDGKIAEKVSEAINKASEVVEEND